MDTLRYYSFLLSIAPCGYVDVWIQGDAGFLEILHFRAKEVNWDFKEVFPTWARDREKTVKAWYDDSYPFVQKAIREKRLSSEYWENLSKKYRWKLTLNDPDMQLYDYSLDLINKERRPYDANGNWLTDPDAKAIPEELILRIKPADPSKPQYKLIIRLKAREDDKYTTKQAYEQELLRIMNRNKELMQLFDTFYAEAGNEAVELQVELKETNGDITSAKLKLKTADKEVYLPVESVTIFNLSY
jgi:hypothetical protein